MGQKWENQVRRADKWSGSFSHRG